MISSFKFFSLILYGRFTVLICFLSQRGCLYNSISTVSSAANAFSLYGWGRLLGQDHKLVYRKPGVIDQSLQSPTLESSVLSLTQSIW